MNIWLQCGDEHWEVMKEFKDQLIKMVEGFSLNRLAALLIEAGVLSLGMLNCHLVSYSYDYFSPAASEDLLFFFKLSIWSFLPPGVSYSK